MRLNLKAILLILTVLVLIITVIYIRCNDFAFPREFVHLDSRFHLDTNPAPAMEDATMRLLDVECLINQEYTIQCKHDVSVNEIYVPFTFLRNYFDVYGTLVTIGPVTKFNWTHSNAKINLPKGRYDARGVFMYFENYNVEVRDRVKCISATEGVPISTQWEKRGYFYPTQIAQFALSHYSKNLTEPEPKIRIIEDADTRRATWYRPKYSNFTRIWHPKFNTNVVQFETAIDLESAISVQADQTLDLVLSLDLLLVTNSSSLIVRLQNRETQQSYNIYYILVDLVLSAQEHNIYYGLGAGAVNRWRRLTRDLLIDVQKGVVATAAASDKKTASLSSSSASIASKIRRNELKVVSIAFLGIGFFDNVTLSTYNHLAHFYDAAEWFVHQQDPKTGGWPNPVKRSLNGFAELRSGWLSAMGQGHAISVLARAYWHSGGDKRFLRAASLGLKSYRVLSKNGGVLAQFMDKYNWYEEYPTTPGSFVLNGFIYSLLGLYDLNSTAPTIIAREAGKLFNEGMYSLKQMLLFYDTGSGTTYDLRHLSLGVAPNLARWDYHATHVNQLLLLATIDSDPIIWQTAKRWKGYMFGKRAKHN